MVAALLQAGHLAVFWHNQIPATSSASETSMGPPMFFPAPTFAAASATTNIKIEKMLARNPRGPFRRLGLNSVRQAVQIWVFIWQVCPSFDRLSSRSDAHDTSEYPRLPISDRF
jgi:hypothetical protein